MKNLVIFKLKKGNYKKFTLRNGKDVVIDNSTLKDGYYLCDYGTHNNHYNSNIITAYAMTYLTNSPNKCRLFINIIQHDSRFNYELSYEQPEIADNVPETDPPSEISSSPFISKANEYMYTSYAKMYGSRSGFDHLLFLLQHGGIDPDAFISAFDYFELDLPLSFEKSLEYPLVFKNLKSLYKDMTYNVTGVKDKTMARLADGFIYKLLVKFDDLYPYVNNSGLNALSRAEIVLEQEL